MAVRRVGGAPLSHAWLFVIDFGRRRRLTYRRSLWEARKKNCRVVFARRKKTDQNDLHNARDDYESCSNACPSGRTPGPRDERAFSREYLKTRKVRKDRPQSVDYIRRTYPNGFQNRLRAPDVSRRTVIYVKKGAAREEEPPSSGWSVEKPNCAI